MRICTNPACEFAQRNTPLDDASLYCPSCGSTTQIAGGAPPPPGATGYAPPPPAGAPLNLGSTVPIGGVDMGTRIGAALIDLCCAIAISLVTLPLGFVPLLGQLLGLLVPAFWLLRDIQGASPGKMVLGLKVSSKSGGLPAQDKLIIRNVTFAAGSILYVIPFIGVFIAGPIALIVGIIEIVMLFTKGERLGDQWANTMVVRK